MLAAVVVLGLIIGAISVYAGYRVTKRELATSPHVFADACITPTETRENLRYMLRVFKKVMHDRDVTWWIDFGTLLAAWRLGDAFAWDHDADIGYLAEDREKIAAAAPRFARMGIDIRLGRCGLFYQGTKLDLE